jgi:2-amino-4-hydroxy-6-hydroxymethyldihydropteridine diphosphokinase
MRPFFGDSIELEKFVFLVAFGGNVENREQFARDSLSCLEKFGSIGRQSLWHLTAPMRSELYNTSEHQDYLNFVFEFYTDLPPEEVYREICVIEDFFGHNRQERWLPRAVDLDLLFWASCAQGQKQFEIARAMMFGSDCSSLRIPHPEIWNRDFLLKMINDELNIEISQLKAKCANPL